MGFKDQMNFKTFHLKVPNDVVNEIHWNAILEIKNQIQKSQQCHKKNFTVY